MFGTKFISVFCFLSCALRLIGQTVEDSTKLEEKKNPYTWENLCEGLDICEADAPKKSSVSDSKITIVKINPDKFDFMLLTATEHGATKPVNAWADSFNLNIVVNAGMYELSNGLINRGFMKNYDHMNNATVNPSYNSMIALNPVDTTENAFAILDLQCNPWNNVKNDYHCYAQGMRMIDCNGQALGWNKRKQSCSMLVAAIDAENNIYYVFSRSPYTHNEMIGFMLDFPFELSNAIYIEGGPETSIYIKVGDRIIEKIGSYVSETYPNDDNDHFWELPNVIGMRSKTLTVKN
jgi:hypothetical protein